jgi:hypothetical protein
MAGTSMMMKRIKKWRGEGKGSFFFLLFYYSYVHTRLGSFLPPCPHPLPYHPLHPLLLPHPLDTQQKLSCPYL